MASALLRKLRPSCLGFYLCFEYFPLTLLDSPSALLNSALLLCLWLPAGIGQGIPQEIKVPAPFLPA